MILRIIGRTARIVLWTLMCLVLLVAGLVIGIYSPGIQHDVAMAAVGMVNRGGKLHIELQDVRIRFPLRLSLEGFSMADALTGDTLAAAASLRAEVQPLPLLKKRVRVPDLTVADGAYNIGNADSAMQMALRIGDGLLHDVDVALGDTMRVRLGTGSLARSRVHMVIRPDTVKKDTLSPPTPMIIEAGALQLLDFDYRMALLPSIPELKATIASGAIAGATVDLLHQRIDIKQFGGHGLDARYIASSEPAPPSPEPSPADTASPPWTVKVHRIAFDRSQALYALQGAKPLPGLDFSYIQASDMTLEVDEFYNQATVVRVPITRLQATERCGVTLDGGLTLLIDDKTLALKDIFLATTNYTQLAGSFMMGMGGDMVLDPSVPLEAKILGQVAPADISLMFPDLSYIIKVLPSRGPVTLAAQADGTSGSLRLHDMRMTVPRVLRLQAAGRLNSIFDPARLALDIDLNGTTDAGIASLASLFLPKDSPLRVPVFTVKGRVSMEGDDYGGDITLRTPKGTMALDGYWHGNAEDYKAAVDLSGFPVDAFMPSLGVGQLTGTVKAEGRGIDFSRPERLNLDASIDLRQATYMGHQIGGVRADASLRSGNADVSLHTAWQALAANATLTGRFTPSLWDGRLSLDIANADLHTLGLTTEPLDVNMQMDLDATLTPNLRNISVAAALASLCLTDADTTTELSNVGLHFNANDARTEFSLENYDLYLTAQARCSLQGLMASMDGVGRLIDRQLKARTLDVEALHEALPQFSIDLVSGNGTDNFLAKLMKKSAVSYDSFNFSVANDSAMSLNLRARSLLSGTTRLDTVDFDIVQADTQLVYRGHVANPPGVNDEFAYVAIDGHLAPSETVVRFEQQNIQGQTGYSLGAALSYADSAVVLRFVPQQATIAYKPWELNKDNYLAYSFARKRVMADLSAHGAGSSIRLTTPPDSTDNDKAQNARLELTDVHLQDWLAVNPFAPPVKGDVSADMNVRWGGGGLWGNGFVTLDSLYYGKERVGNIKADLDVTTLKTGLMKADVALFVDGVKTATLQGSLNDSTRATPFNLDFKMFHFPLATVNPFLPSGTARLTGWLNGNMDISGSKENSILDGTLTFDSAAVKIDILGSTYPISSSPIAVHNSVVTMQDFGITALNGNPLRLNGTVDIMDLASPRVDVTLSGQNLQIVSSKRLSKGADIYGKAFIDLTGSAKGNTGTFMRVNADLAVLPETNVTYVIPDAANAITQYQNSEMVKFVNFNDTAQVEEADSIANKSMVMNLDALLTLQSGCVINVDLSTDGKNKVRLEPQGTLNFSMPPLSDARLTGRVNIEQGFVRYTPPLMSEKLFTFDDGSYVAFNGPVMNPQLNIHATDAVKANVTEAGQNSRLITFDVMLGITGTLSQMDVKFDLSTDDDMTVANELSSMSPEQRANQAMALLLYNTYTGGGARGDANLSGNPLYTFLSSQLNTWAANTIKGVDLTFGIDQYSNTQDGTTRDATQYSYQISKTLFNDKFKIVVGGNYSTDANADENFRQNLINDISFEYYLNRARSIYLTLFRHTGYESILEGEVTQTGVGFVYRRRLRSLRSLFHRDKKPKAPADTADTTSTPSPKP